jgi:two-component system, OmpR family, response regulator VicR
VAKKILVADDEPAIADLLQTTLAEEGYDVQKSTQSLRFYDAVRQQQPDLEGEDELRLLQLSPETANIPVIVVTAKPDVGHDEQRLRQLGVRHIVRKPFDLIQLIALVNQTIG